jgi:hypothetical protein
MAWLNAALTGGNEIPPQLVPLLRNPAEFTCTGDIPVFDEADSLFVWANALEGGEDKDAPDSELCTSILTYLDSAEELRNELFFKQMGKDHPWIVLCKRLAAKRKL